MNRNLVDWIWNIRGSVALAPGQTSEETFTRLDPLFRQTGTSREWSNDRLTFTKKDQAAQDKMAVFDGGVLQIERDAATPVLRYSLTSRFLLFCFLAPLLFLAFAQVTIAVGNYEAAKKAAEAKADKPGAKKKKDEDKPPQALNPIDKALGAPEPEKKKKKKDERPSPTPAYVFAGIFATLYVVGRVLEARLVKSLFRKRLLGA